MSEYVNDGGPAFPTPIAGCTDGSVYSTIEKHAGQNGGMTLRDWFAGMALQGFKANPSTCSSIPYEETAQICYIEADAMLEARAVKHA